MRTGPTKKSTRELIVDLEKQGKKSGKKVWKDVAARLGKPSRNLAKVNVYKLNALSKKFPGKIFVVPGKVLSSGDVDSKIGVACFTCSEKAREKIEAGKGKVMSLKELVGAKVKESSMVIVR